MKNFAAVAALMLGIVGNACATVIVDQQYYSDERNANGAGSYSDFRRAQTFTVGVDGLLNSVQVFGLNFRSINILNTSSGVPQTILGSTDVFQSAGDAFTFDVSALGISVAVGEVYAFEVIGGALSGDAIGQYAGGSDFFINPRTGDTSFTPTRFDSYFLTTVDNLEVAVPEPSSAALLLIAGAAIASSRRRFTAKS